MAIMTITDEFVKQYPEKSISKLTNYNNRPIKTHFFFVLLYIFRMFAQVF